MYKTIFSIITHTLWNYLIIGKLQYGIVGAAIVKNISDWQNLILLFLTAKYLGHIKKFKIPFNKASNKNW